MNKELEELIHQRIEELKKPFKISEKYSEVNKFVEEHKLDTLDDYLNLDMISFVKIRLYTECNISLEEAERIAAMIVEVDCKEDYPLKKIYDLFQDTNDTKLKKLYVDCLCSNTIKTAAILAKYRIADERIWKHIAIMKEMLRGTKTNPELIRKTIEFGEIIPLMVDFADAQRKINKNKELLLSDQEEFKQEHNTNSRLDKMMARDVKKIINRSSKRGAILAELKKPKEFVAEEDKNRNRYNKNNKKELESLQEAIKTFEEALSKGEIINAEKIVKNIKDEKIKHKILEIIYNHNLEINNKLQQEYDSLLSNNGIKYSSLFSKYNLNINSDDALSYAKHKIEDLEEMLKLFTVLNIPKGNVFNILLRTDMETFNIIKKQFDRGILSQEFLERYLNIFDKNSDEYKTFESNINTLESLEINANTFSRQPQLLLTDSNVFKKNLTVLKEYYYLPYLKSANELDFLTADDLEKRIDMLLELGYEKELEKQIDLLNFDNIERLVLLKQIGVESDSDDLFNVLNDEDFFIPGNITPYLQNMVDYTKERVLEEGVTPQTISTRVVKVGDVLISKNKMERKLREGNNLQDAMLYNLYLDETEYESLKIK